MIRSEMSRGGVCAHSGSIKEGRGRGARAAAKVFQLPAAAPAAGHHAPWAWRAPRRACDRTAAAARAQPPLAPPAGAPAVLPS